MKVSKVSCMFSDHATGAHFPTMREVINAYYHVHTDEYYDEWLAVAEVPKESQYIGEDGSTWAMDSTNYEVIRDALSGMLEVPEIIQIGRHNNSKTAAKEDGIAIIRSAYSDYLVIRPDMEDLIHEARHLVGLLESYPLLDDEAYYRLEEESLIEYLLSGAVWDELRDDDTLTEEQREEFEALSDEEILNLARDFDWSDGWEGSYEPSLISIWLAQ